MLKHFQEFTTFVILIFGIFQGCFIVADPSSCGDWLPFHDEKCFKILDITTRSYADAMKACEVLDGYPSLPTIESKEEQDFLVNYLFITGKKVNNFWLGAKFTDTAYKWSDDALWNYSNWDKDSPRNKANYCVQMIFDEARRGKWIDEPCEQSNAVVCQKMQTWTMARLQKSFVKVRKELESAKREIVEANNRIKHNDEESNQKIVEASARISNLTQNPVPIGFIYVQLSSQPEPRTLWPTVEWKDVTTEYAGLFFRAEGTGSEKFGTVQAENAPRVTEVRHSTYPASQGIGHWETTTLNVGGWSSGIGIFAGSFDGQYGHAHQFHQSGGEVRPRNSAIRVWKRTK